MSEYCHLCDFDPCVCGRQGRVEPISHKKVDRAGPRGLDEAVRDFVMSSHESGGHHNWAGWLELLVDRFGSDDAAAVRAAWNRVKNSLQRQWLLIDDPDEQRNGPMLAPAGYPQVRLLTLPQAVAEVEMLISDGRWTVDEPGLRLWQVWRRIPDVLYVSIYDALHDMKGRGHMVTTTSPSGKPSQFWYLIPEVPLG